MALNIVTLLPSLYNIQKTFEDYTLQYGPVVYMDPNDDGNAKLKPSKAKNVSTILSVTQNLIDYFNTKNGINNEYMGKQSLADMYYALVLSIIVVLISILVGLGIWQTFKKVDEGTKEPKGKVEYSPETRNFKYIYDQLENYYKQNEFKSTIPNSFIRFSIAMIVLSSIGFSISYIVKIYNFNSTLNSKLYNTSLIETNNIGRLVNMFRVTSANSTGISLDSANVAYEYYYQKNNQSVKVTWDTFEPCDSTFLDVQNNDSAADKVPKPGQEGLLGMDLTVDAPDAEVEVDATADATDTVAPSEPSKSQCTGSVHDSKLLYPFVNSVLDTIEPFILKQEIQKLDLYGQLDRLSNSIAYIKSFLLRSSDQVYSTISSTISEKSRQELRDAIVAIILDGATVVHDVAAPSSVTSTTTASAADCFAACMNSPSYMGASYANGSCKLIKSDTNLVYTGASSSNLMLIKSGFNLGVTGGSVGSNFNSFASSTCGSNTNGCLINGANVYVATSGNVTYTDILTATATSATAATASNYTYYGNTSNIISDNSRNGTLSVVTLLSKWLVGEISDTIIKTDTTNTFTLDQEDSDYILAHVSSRMGTAFSLMSGPLTNVLTEIPLTLAQKMGNTVSRVVPTKYIPVDRFQQKVMALNSRDFITQLVFNTDEIRATSSGINTLTTNYGTTYEENMFYTECRNTGLQWLLVTLILVVVICFFKFLLDCFEELDCAKKPVAEPIAAAPAPLASIPTSGGDCTVCMDALANIGKELMQQGGKRGGMPETGAETPASGVSAVGNSSVKGDTTKPPENSLMSNTGLIKEVTKTVGQVGEITGLIGDITKIPGLITRYLYAHSEKSLLVPQNFTNLGKIMQEGIELGQKIVKKMLPLLSKDTTNDDSTINTFLVNTLGLTQIGPNVFTEAENGKPEEFIEYVTTCLKQLISNSSKLCDLINKIPFLNGLGDIQTHLDKFITDLKTEIEKKKLDEKNKEMLTLAIDLVKKVKDCIGKSSTDKSTNPSRHKTSSSSSKPCKKKDPKKPNDNFLDGLETSPWVPFTIKLVFTICFVMVFYSFLKNIATKKNANVSFNYTAMTANATKLQQASRSCVQVLYGDIITNDYYGIKSSVHAPSPHLDENITLDPYFQATAHEPQIDAVFTAIAGGSIVDNSINVKVSNSASIEQVYNEYIVILEAYDRCNSIFELQGQRMPFPIVECTLYGLVLIVSLFAIYIIYDRFQPTERFQIYDKVKRMKKIYQNDVTKVGVTEKIGTQDALAKWSEDLELVSSSDHSVAGQRKDKNVLINKSLIKLLGCAVTISVVGLFINALQSDTDSYSAGLQSTYGTDTCV